MSVIKDKKEFAQLMASLCVRDDGFNNVPESFWSDPGKPLRCRYDHFEFEGPVFSYPVSCDDEKWLVRGVFCSPHCVKSFITNQRGIPTECFTQFSYMMLAVYQMDNNIPEAADLNDLLYTDMSVEEWRNIPRRHLTTKITIPQKVPFDMLTLQRNQYPVPSHPQYEQLQTWTHVIAEDDGDIEMESCENASKTAKKKNTPRKKRGPKKGPKMKGPKMKVTESTVDNDPTGGFN